MEFNTGIFEFLGKAAGPLEVPAGTSNSVALKMDENFFIDGGEFFVQNGAMGDYIKAEVVDVDNKLGYGENAVLRVYIEKWFVIPNQSISIRTPYAGEIPKNLYLKVTYTSVGNENVIVWGNYRLHRKVS